MRRLPAVAALLMALTLRAAQAADTTPPPALQADATPVRVLLGAASVRAGKELRVDLEADLPAGSTLQTPALGPSLGAWDVRNAVRLPVDPAWPGRVVERLTLVTFETGTVEVPSLTFTLRGPDGKETPACSPAVTVQVESVLSEGYDPARIRQLKDVVEMQLQARWPWALAAGLLVGAAGWWIWRRWRARPVAPPPPEPCDRRALRELDELAARQLPQKGLVLDFYVLLSDTVRRYVEGRFSIRAPEQTTKEFLQAARFHPLIREDHQRMLAAFLRAADMVKFAAQRPGPGECERGLDAARGFVRESAPSVADAAAPPHASAPHAAWESPR